MSCSRCVNFVRCCMQICMHLLLMRQKGPSTCNRWFDTNPLQLMHMCSTGSGTLQSSASSIAVAWLMFLVQLSYAIVVCVWCPHIDKFKWIAHALSVWLQAVAYLCVGVFETFTAASNLQVGTLNSCNLVREAACLSALPLACCSPLMGNFQNCRMLSNPRKYVACKVSITPLPHSGIYSLCNQSAAVAVNATTIPRAPSTTLASNGEASCAARHHQSHFCSSVTPNFLNATPPGACCPRSDMFF